jgi:hypothetical protein
LPVKPLGDKESRASAVSPLFESGRVFLPESAPWLDDYIDELTSFPASPHDDQVDSTTQALQRLHQAGVQLSQSDRDFQRRALEEIRIRSTLTFSHMGDRSNRNSLYANAEACAMREDAEEAIARVLIRRFNNRKCFP